MIDILQEFFARNTILVYFIYGLVFFLLGFGVALQSWRHTRLELAPSLRWLAAFGIIHGIHEWGAIIVPFQAMYVSDAAMTLMLTLQLVTLVVSFFCLFQFGVELLSDRWPWIVNLPIVISAFWFIVFFVPAVVSDVSSVAWQREGSIWARYLLGFPGAMLAAYGLYYQAKRQIEPLDLPDNVLMFEIAAVAMGAYAVLAGLIVPPGDFFPANIINSANLLALTGIPVFVFRSLAGAVIAVTVIRGLGVFEVEVDRQFEQMEIERSLVSQRELIGQELHDGAIQQVYTAGLIIESVRNKADDPQQEQRLDMAMSAMNEAIAGLRSYMDNLRAGEAQVSLVEGLREQAADPRLLVLMQVELDLQLNEYDTMSPLRTNRVLAVASQALANAARHGHAKHIAVRARRQRGSLHLVIEDDGGGFKTNSNGQGYGLRDMRDHARLLNGELTVDSSPGKGTRIVLTAPWNDR